MARLGQLLVAGAIAALASAHIEVVGKRAETGNILGYGMQRIAEDGGLAGLAPPTQHKGSKNVSSVPQLKDRTAELFEKRQYCDAGYGYCSELGFCCPDTDMCCGWGYCIAPEDVCCPYGACDAGETCCGDGCLPPGADCCSDGNYCEAGNQCIIDLSTSEIVCCTDEYCTAYVESGTTSYLTATATYTDVATTDAPASTITDAPSFTTYTEYEWTTWYMTITWWYFSYYWYTYEQTSSTVTYDMIYETTTYTTTATDDYEASSWYYSMSESLTFDPPSDAQTSLASLLGETPSETATATVDDSFGTTSSEPRSTSALSLKSSSRTSTTASATSGVASSTSSVEASPGSASLVIAESALVGFAALCGVMMVWL